MASRMDEFRAFLTKYPGIVEDVKNGNHSWQQMYENWVVLGENDASWQKYQTAPVLKETEQKAKSNTIEELLSSTSLKNVVNYVKKIDPDSISKTQTRFKKYCRLPKALGEDLPEYIITITTVGGINVTNGFR